MLYIWKWYQITDEIYKWIISEIIYPFRIEKQNLEVWYTKWIFTPCYILLDSSWKINIVGDESQTDGEDLKTLSGKWTVYSLACSQAACIFGNDVHGFYISDVIMGAMAFQITSLTSVYSTVYSGVYSSANQRKQQSSASLAFVWGIHRSPVNSPHKWPVTRQMFPFDDVIMFRDVC